MSLFLAFAASLGGTKWPTSLARRGMNGEQADAASVGAVAGLTYASLFTNVVSLIATSHLLLGLSIADCSRRPWMIAAFVINLTILLAALLLLLKVVSSVEPRALSVAAWRLPKWSWRRTANAVHGDRRPDAAVGQIRAVAPKQVNVALNLVAAVLALLAAAFRATENQNDDCRALGNNSSATATSTLTKALEQAEEIDPACSGNLSFEVPT